MALTQEQLDKCKVDFVDNMMSLLLGEYKYLESPNGWLQSQIPAVKQYGILAQADLDRMPVVLTTT